MALHWTSLLEAHESLMPSCSRSAKESWFLPAHPTPLDSMDGRHSLTAFTAEGPPSTLENIANNVTPGKDTCPRTHVHVRTPSCGLSAYAASQRGLAWARAWPQ